jgi:hypothetical protein
VALLFNPAPPVYVEPLSQPILPFYSDRFQLDDWRESLGFKISVFSAILYLVGFGFSFVLDINPRKNLLLRLMKDLRNIDRYGLREGEVRDYMEPDP